jgi:hypothetical protein
LDFFFLGSSDFMLLTGQKRFSKLRGGLLFARGLGQRIREPVPLLLNGAERFGDGQLLGDPTPLKLGLQLPDFGIGQFNGALFVTLG